jgi:Mor family transcriptional regulator
MKSTIPKEAQEKILEDFRKGGDNRVSVLAERYGVSKNKVSKLINDFLKPKQHATNK